MVVSVLADQSAPRGPAICSNKMVFGLHLVLGYEMARNLMKLVSVWSWFDLDVLIFVQFRCPPLAMLHQDGQLRHVMLCRRNTGAMGFNRKSNKRSGCWRFHGRVLCSVNIVTAGSCRRPS